MEILTVEQQNAIDLLVLGQTDQQVAERVGVTCQTVNEWRNHDAEFIAQLNQRRCQLWEIYTDRLRYLLGRAVEVIGEDIESVDPRIRSAAAIQFLSLAGLRDINLKPDEVM